MKAKFQKMWLDFFLSACTVLHELIVQPSLICRCIMETHVSCSEHTHMCTRPGLCFLNIWYVHMHASLFFPLCFTLNTANMENGEILFLVKISSLFRVYKWMDPEKVNLIVVRPPQMIDRRNLGIFLCHGWLQEGWQVTVLQIVL